MNPRILIYLIGKLYFKINLHILKISLRKVHIMRESYKFPRIMFLNYNKTLNIVIHCLNMKFYLNLNFKCT